MRQTALLGSILLFCAAANAADQQLLNMVMPEAKVVAGLNVLQAKASPFGNYVLLQMTSNQKAMQDFVIASGFNPALDVTEILAATSGDKATPAGVVLARGTFNTSAITAAILKDGRHKVSDYAGATLVTSSDPAEKNAVAFLSGTIAVAGDLASVQGALDRRNSGSAISPVLSTQVATLSSTQDAWTISIASLASLFPVSPAGADQQLAVFKNIQQSSGGVKFGADVKVTAQALTTDAKDATALGDVLRFVAQLVAMNAGKNPQAAGAASLLQNLNVTTDGTAVNIAMTIPEANLESLLQGMHDAHGTALK